MGGSRGLAGLVDSPAQSALANSTIIFFVVLIACFGARHNRTFCLGARSKVCPGPDRRMELPCSNRQADGQRGHCTERWRAGLEQLRSGGGTCAACSTQLAFLKQAAQREPMMACALSGFRYLCAMCVG